VRYLSLFSGIEAASAAWAGLGWKCAAVAEVEPFPCAVLAHRHPGVPSLGDVTKITEATIQALGHIDIVVFGSPCQDLSVAGQRKGLINEHGDITRSGLFFTAINIFHWSGARFALWENVPGAFSSGQGRDFASVVSFMAGLDDVGVPPNGWGTEGAALGDNGLLEWGTLDAQWFGVAQRRRRVFALLDTGDWAGRPPILLEPESLRGDSAPRREAGESVAPTIDVRAGRSGETTFHTSGGLAIEPNTFTCGGIGSYSSSSSSPLLRTGADLGPGCESLIAFHTNAQPDEMNFSPHTSAALTCSQRAGVAHVETMPTMQTGSGNPSGHGARSGDTKDAYVVPVVTHALRDEGFDASEDGTRRETPLVPVAQPCAVAFVQNTRDEVRLMNGDGRIAGALSAEPGMKQQCYVASAMQVRRLTPKECERLQGFPDDHTAIPYRNKPAADGPRYKALGNSMAVPVMRWIGIKIMEAVWN